MKKSFLFLAAMMTFGLASLQAEEQQPDGIYVWANGSSTCYQLSKMPYVTYEGNEAILTVDQEEQLRVTLEDGATMVVTYGVYVPEGVENVDKPSPVYKNGKIISGGRLIIIRDGKQYDVHGNQIH